MDFVPVLDILVENEVKDDPFQGCRRSLCSRHEEIPNAVGQVKHIQVLATVLADCRQVNVDEILGIFRIKICRMFFHFLDKMSSDPSHYFDSLSRQSVLVKGCRYEVLNEGGHHVSLSPILKHVAHSLYKLNILGLCWREPLVCNHLPENVDDRNVEVVSEKDVTRLGKSGIDHFISLKVYRLLDAFPTKTEVLQRLEGEPPLSAPVKSLGVDDSQRDWVIEPVNQQELVTGPSIELLPLKEILAQLKVIEDMERLGPKRDRSNPMGSDMWVEGPAEHTLGDIEEGKTAQEWE